MKVYSEGNLGKKAAARCGLIFRTQYDWEADEREGLAAGCSCLGEDGLPQESKTQQSFQLEVDINEIVRRCGIKDHELPVAPPIDPRFYGDVSDLPDLRTALDRVKDASDRFMALPAPLRARFHNRPALLYDFVMREENFEECCRLGLLQAPSPPPPPTPPTPGQGPGSPPVTTPV